MKPSFSIGAPLLITLLLTSSVAGWAATAEELIAQLGSDKEPERSAAIEGLRKLGADGQAALKKARETVKLEPQAALLARRLMGEPLVNSSPLKPLDLNTLIALGEDKSKNLPGNPALRYNKDNKTIAIEGCFMLENGPLELLAVSRVPNAKVHETIVALSPLPRDICTVLLVCAYAYAGEITEEGKIELPKDAGVMVSVEFLHEPTHAHMQPTLDAATLIWGLFDKAQALDKVLPEIRTLMLWDMEGDLAILRNFLAVPAENDDILKKEFLEQLHKLVEKEKEIYDDKKRETLVAKLVEYLTLDNGGVKPQRSVPVVTWNKRLTRVPIEFFAWNTSTEKPMRRVPFAFTGSRFEKDPNGKHVFVADLEGSVVALKLDAYAVLNTMLDTKNVDPQHAAGYAIHTDIVPHRLARCRLVLEPWGGGGLTDEDLKDIGEKKTPGMSHGNRAP